MGVDGDHALGRAGVGAGRGGVEARVGVEPEQGADAFAADGVGAESVAPPAVLGGVLPGAVHAPLALRIVMVHGEGVVRPVVGLAGGGIDLGPLVAVTAEPLSSEADAIPIGQSAGVQPGGAALHEGVVPVLPAVARVAVDAVLDGDAGEGFRVRVSGAELDDPAEGGGAVEYAAGAFDDLDLLEVLQREEAPGGPAGISAENRQSVQEDGDPGAGAEAVSAAAADLGFTVDDGHAGGAGQALVGAGGCALVDQLGGQYVDGDAYFAEVLLVPSRGDHGGADAGDVGFEADLEGLFASPGVEILAGLDVSDVANAQDTGRVARFRSGEGEAAIEVGQDAAAVEEHGCTRQWVGVDGVEDGALQAPSFLGIQRGDGQEEQADHQGGKGPLHGARM